MLAGLCAALWARVFTTTSTLETATECRLPSTTTPAAPGTPSPIPTRFGVMLPRDSLDATQPLPPQQVRVQVLNASGRSGQAALVGEELAPYGFATGGPPGDDPIYARGDLTCHGQIRFGPTGAAAARTLSLAAPCAQLVRDNRPDANVDLVVGTRLNDIKMTNQAEQILQQLHTQGTQHAQGGTARSAPGLATALLAQARDHVVC